MNILDKIWNNWSVASGHYGDLVCRQSYLLHQQVAFKVEKMEQKIFPKNPQDWWMTIRDNRSLQGSVIPF